MQSQRYSLIFFFKIVAEIILPPPLPPDLTHHIHWPCEPGPCCQSGALHWSQTQMVLTRMVTFDTFFWSSVKSDLSRYIMKA